MNTSSSSSVKKQFFTKSNVNKRSPSIHQSSKESSTSSVAEEDFMFSSVESVSIPLTNEDIIDNSEETACTINSSDIFFDTSIDICNHANTSREKGRIICDDCGIELYEEISYEQDWRYFGEQDSRNNKDPSRVQYRKTPEKGIKKELERLGFPPDICELSDKLYMTVTKGEIKRSELRKGIMFSVVYESYRMKNKPKTPEELQDIFGLDSKSISQGLTYYRLRCPKENFSHDDINPKHYIPAIMEKFKTTREHIDKVMLLYDRIKGVATILNRSKPQSTSKALVYYYLRRKGCKIKPSVYGKIVQLSEVIILRLSGEISRILNTQDTVDLL